VLLVSGRFIYHVGALVFPVASMGNGSSVNVGNPQMLPFTEINHYFT
jgi:hypothetical protein